MIYKPETTALLFDFDGTLLNSGDKVPLDVQAAFEMLGTQLPLEEAGASKNWEATAAKYGYSKDQFWHAFKRARESWAESLKKGKAQLYEDAKPALDRLVADGYINLALVTRSVPEETMVKVLELGLGDYFSAIKVTPPDNLHIRLRNKRR